MEDFSKDSIKCTYKLGVSNPADNPHISYPVLTKKIYDDVL
jgi:hypothetical protein